MTWLALNIASFTSCLVLEGVEHEILTDAKNLSLIASPIKFKFFFDE